MIYTPAVQFPPSPISQVLLVLVILMHKHCRFIAIPPMHQPLIIRVKKGSDLSNQEIADMYAVRSHFMLLKPEVPKKKDEDFFAATVKAAHQVFLFVTKTGDIKGLYVVTSCLERSTLNKKKRLVVEPEFGFILDEYQGKYLSKTVRRNAIKAFFQYPFIPKYLIGPAYPASYLTLKKYGGKVWAWQDKAVPAHVKDVIATYARRHNMWDDVKFTGVKSLYTLPKHINQQHLERLEKKPGYTHYKNLNPQWMEGNGLITLTQLKFSTLLRQIFKKNISAK
jgi:hypothetical protein